MRLLREAIAREGIEGKVLSALLGMHRGSISHAKRGDYRLPYRALYALKEYFGDDFVKEALEIGKEDE